MGRDQTARHTRAGIVGVRRGKRVPIAKPDPAAARHLDPVKRKLTAATPNQLWVSDPTFVPTWAGLACVRLIINAFSRMIVEWRAASHIRTTMALDAIEMARWSPGNTLPGLIFHSDAGSQFMSIRHSERLPEIDTVPPTGSIGDRFDNTLTETVNGYYLIYEPARTGPWKTLGWVHWHNTARLHGYLDDIPRRAITAELLEASGASAQFLSNPLQRFKRDVDIAARRVRLRHGPGGDWGEDIADRDGVIGYVAVWSYCRCAASTIEPAVKNARLSRSA